MSSTIVVGGFFGDEGKGKIIMFNSQNMYYFLNDGMNPHWDIDYIASARSTENRLFSLAQDDTEVTCTIFDLVDPGRSSWLRVNDLKLFYKHHCKYCK